ncbi:sensor histidine kinase [Actinoalloteichus sp. AHMU CJ021]|uniref:histidine kinase n=1 Tax=Actinoalloteichus caeruleus DSM 43889 TaxID=1120930 RepID=A0ABT1JGY2_ACTCY|nr:sensor histidine kinase [Actinoalloteichus caeruleus]AUS77800.1 sensor histidine kinase [Actinoalloteichus sp. AHMU CJ021]MCP2331755.1 Signal transduction histidine kinase [Actinoalloteichus caeruleus DSM 43889]
MKQREDPRDQLARWRTAAGSRFREFWTEERPPPPGRAGRVVWTLLTLLAGILGVTVFFYTSDHYSKGALELLHGLPRLLVAALVCAPLVVSRYRPMTAWSLSLVGVVVPLLAQPVNEYAVWPWLPQAVAVYLVVQYQVAAHRPPRVAITAWMTMLAVGPLVAWAVAGAFTGTSVPSLGWFSVLSGVALLVGYNVRLRRQASAELHQQERLSATERGRRELLEERARIARELHDVVAHHMSVIAVQSATVSRRRKGINEEAREEFDSIAAAARTSLGEMRRLLSVLRADDSEPETEPQPHLDRLGEVVDATRRAGTPVSLDLGDLPEDVPDLVQLTAYRTVQEALSNVVRHASGATSSVEVRGDGRGLVVSVRNDRPPADRPGVAKSGDGYGLLGIRERVALLGGETMIGPTPAGGFLVTVVLPLAEPGSGADEGENR